MGFNGLEQLKKVQQQKNVLRAQLGIARGINMMVRMREMKQTERALRAANIPMKELKYNSGKVWGHVVPTSPVAKAMIRQGKALTGASRTSQQIGGGYTKKILQANILAERTRTQGERISQLETKLKNRPTIIKEVQPKQDLFNFEFPSLPSLGDLKTPVLIAAGALGGLWLLGKVISKK